MFWETDEAVAGVFSRWESVILVHALDLTNLVLDEIPCRWRRSGGYSACFRARLIAQFKIVYHKAFFQLVLLVLFDIPIPTNKKITVVTHTGCYLQVEALVGTELYRMADLCKEKVTSVDL